MEKETKFTGSIADADGVTKAFSVIAERSQRIVSAFLDRQALDQTLASAIDPLHIGDAFLQMTAQMLASPVQIVEAQMSLWSNYMQLWQNTARRMMVGSFEPDPAPAEAASTKSADWPEGDVFDFIKQSYLLAARWIQSLVKGAGGLDDDTARKIDFYTRQFIDAMAPATFFANNPELLRATIESNGENLIKGLDHLLGDLERGKDRLALPTRPFDIFTPGDNIATTPGKVIFSNGLIELLHYAPTTATVHKTPLLIVPPWTHKYYILDLQSENSLVKWTIDQGHDVFLLSWVNPVEGDASSDFSDYMTDGPLAALEAIKAATGERKVNGLGFCVGGTLLAATAAYLAAQGEERFVSTTYLAAMLDYSEVGEISVFVDEEQLRLIDQKSDRAGATATAISLLRANDLIWSFVIDTFKLGRTPFPFDLLHWNSDVPNLPKAVQRFYLRSLYQNNLLAQPGGVVLKGTSIDLGKVKTPSYVVAAAEDHIAPWKTVFAATRLLGGPARFVRAASGHAAGIIDRPDGSRQGFWTNNEDAKDADSWLAGAARQQGSWWKDWERWLAKQAGRRVSAERPAGGKLKPLADAPGRFVRSSDSHKGH